MAEVLRAIGLMSGTSMDGIDVAQLETDGEDMVRIGDGVTVPYSAEQREMLAAALQDALEISARDQRPGVLVEAENMITKAHEDAVRLFLRGKGLTSDMIDIIGFHGHTVLHRPERRLTVQIGRGDELSNSLGIRISADMRAADVAAGGQGAPIVPVYHRALAASLIASPVAIVNIGGVANVTYVGRDGQLLAFDTGPGNALLDDWVCLHGEHAMDEGGYLASMGRGQFDPVMLDSLLNDSYFDLRPPKSLDRNHDWKPVLDGLPLEVGAALLAEFTVRSVARSVEWFPETPAEWVICGGGRHNREFVHLLRGRVEGNVSIAEEHGLDGDAIEAQAFAYLAVRALKALPLTFPGTTGCPMPMTGGVIFRP